jgi:hypothetical protein
MKQGDQGDQIILFSKIAQTHRIDTQHFSGAKK